MSFDRPRLNELRAMRKANRTRIPAVIGIVAGLAVSSGCAVWQPPPASPDPRRDAPAGRDDGGEAAAPGRSPAIAALDERAGAAFRAGRFGEAAATLERALAIDARDASLWLFLGWVRLAQGDAAQARVLASRARGLTRDAGLACRADRLEASRATGRAAIDARADAGRACGPARS